MNKTNQTSLLAYHNLNKHRVGSQIQQIYQLIRDSPIALSDRQISQRLNLQRNIVESRTSQLEREGVILCAGCPVDKATGNHSRTWKVK